MPKEVIVVEGQVRTCDFSSHATLSREERLRIVDEIRAMTPKDVQQTDSAEMIRALRDANYDLD